MARGAILEAIKTTPGRNPNAASGIRRNPNGVATQSPGLLYSATLGRASVIRHNPNGVVTLEKASHGLQFMLPRIERKDDHEESQLASLALFRVTHSY